MQRLGLLFFVCGAALWFGGCASESPKPTDTAPISTIPWNQPERGEGSGMMGSMLNTR